MSKKIWALFVLSFALMASVAGFNLSAQTPIAGNWKGSLVEENSKINLKFVRAKENSREHQMGQTFDLADVGLTREQVLNGGPVKFSLVREAGTIECEGSFENGKGSGTFRFTGSPTFAAAMKSRGFDFEKDPPAKEHGGFEDTLFAATVLNVTTALADDLNSAGFGKLTVGDLFKATIFKIDSAFMREMKATVSRTWGWRNSSKRASSRSTRRLCVMLPRWVLIKNHSRTS
jgi:hypothetical protein